VSVYLLKDWKKTATEKMTCSNEKGGPIYIRCGDIDGWVSPIIQYSENCLRLSPTITPPSRRDKTVFSCVGGVNYAQESRVQPERTCVKCN